MPKIVDKIVPGQPFYSFEYFPPKTNAGETRQLSIPADFIE